MKYLNGWTLFSLGLFLIMIHQLYMWRNESFENTAEKPPTEYKQYDTSQLPLILSQQNAGNIEYLKTQLKQFEEMDGRLKTTEQQIQAIQTQIDGLVQQQAMFATDLAGDQPPVITGTDLSAPATD